MTVTYHAYGIDYTGGLSAATIRRSTIDGHHVTFVCRYLSGFSKDLTPAEARGLSAAGVSIVVVFETTATEAEKGHAAGVRDATAALAEARRCGMPEGRPIYMAVDEDTTVGSHITAYFKGVASVLGLARTGAYGGYRVIKALFDKHLITWGWQTYAWSGGKWESRAHLQQYSNDHTLSGASVDYDRAIKADFGQWRVGAAPPTQEDDVAEVASVSVTEQTAEPGSETPVRFSRVITDSHKLAQKDGVSIVIPKSAGKLWAIATANLTLSGMQAGEPVDIAWTLIAERADGSWYEAYQQYRDTWFAGEDGRIRRTLPAQFGLDAAYRLQLRLYPGASAVTVEAGTWDVTLLKF